MVLALKKKKKTQNDGKELWYHKWNQGIYSQLIFTKAPESHSENGKGSLKMKHINTVFSTLKFEMQCLKDKNMDLVFHGKQKWIQNGKKSRFKIKPWNYLKKIDEYFNVLDKSIVLV